MRVLIMGAGGMGGYFGGVLAQQGHDVVFVARGPHLAAMRERGLEIRTGEQAVRLQPVRAAERPDEAGSDVDLVLFTVKTYDTEAAAAALQPALGRQTAVLPLQNGVESVDRLSVLLGAEHVLVGTAQTFATIVEPGVIALFSPWTWITLGEQSGAVTPRVEAIAEAFQEAGVRITISVDARLALWQKFVGLAPAATITSVCETPMGPVWDTPEGEALFRTLIGEAIRVGQALGVPLPDDALEEKVAYYRAQGPAASTSMRLDFERRRKVEMEHLTGAVVRLGREAGVPTPAFDVLYGVLKVRAGSFGGLS